MSLRALQSAGTGMHAFEFELDVVANNLANAGTTGFKRERANFEDLFYEQMRLPGAPDANGNPVPLGVEVGLGTRVASTQRTFTQGNMVETAGELDVAIGGDGFFVVEDENETLYTRDGAFTRNADGELVLASADKGRRLVPGITLPPDTVEVSISPDGVVSVLQQGQEQAQQVGQLQLARFVNPQGLIHRGENLYSATDASGQALEGNPGEEGRGVLRQSYLEQSNVEPVRELVGLIKTQRNFELNTQVVQAADSMLEQIANLRRF
ncbi:flagellar basal-body rod protein FlgG [Alienimonas sp. DA493]|uniref:flagellar basal-body rod protein FlgG n=1 Tax=Alienimonas sp. DA493 TaxID=3373605 RepID=UPI0037546EDB